MGYRYRTRILDHTVSIISNGYGRYDVTIQGPSISAEHDKTFLTIHEAKIEAHAFAHSALSSQCGCGELKWIIALGS